MKKLFIGGIGFMKTKLGISVALMAALAYFMGFFGGVVSLVLFTGYVLLFEENEFVRKSAVKSFLIMAAFAVLSALVGFIPNIISLINSLLSIFGKSFSISVVSRIITFLQLVLDLLEKILFLALGFLALGKKNMKISVIDKFVEKHFGNVQ